MMTVKNKQISSIVHYELIFSKLSPDLSCIPHPVMVTKRKFISPLWHCQQGGKQPAAFRRIPAPWCVDRCKGFHRRRTEDRRAAHFSGVSAWASSASAAQVLMARLLGWAHLLSLLLAMSDSSPGADPKEQREKEGAREGPWEPPGV